MSRNRIEERMHEVLDGAATAAEREALERDLSADPSLRARFEELRGLFEALGRVPMAEPPADLHGDILRSIERERARPAAPGWMESIAMAFRSRPIPAYAMTLVSVAAAGLLLYTAMRQPAPGGDVTATMAPVQAPLSLAAGDASLAIRTRWIGDQFVIGIHGEAPSGARVALRFDEASWTPAAPGGSPEATSWTVRGTVDAEFRLTLRSAPATPVSLVLETPEATQEISLPLARRDVQH